MNSKIIDNAITYISELFKDNSDGHDVGHTLRVFHLSKQIAEHYEEIDATLISLTALLHDVDDHKLFDTKNNENARKFLLSQDVDDVTIDTICNIINSISYSKNKGQKPTSIEAQIVQDADRLDAIGAIGIARTFSYGGNNHRSLKQSIEHFYDKLLLLKDMMNTDIAKQIAEERHKYLEEYLKELNKELGECE